MNGQRGSAKGQEMPDRARASRRAFLKGLGAGAATMIALDLLEGAAATPARAGVATAPPAPPPAAPPGAPSAAAPPPLPAGATENLLLRMQEDLQRAMRKPGHERRWIMVIDLRKCVGCSACTIGCIAENRLPPGVVYRPVVDEEIGTYPHVTRRFVPRPCMQCENPPVLPVCPVKATYKRPDGIVEINYDTCIGCRYCITACPYSARYFDAGDFHTAGTPAIQAYERAPNHEYGRHWVRRRNASPIGNVRKCHFCIHRLDAGMLPACVTTCIGQATFFGDGNDPESLATELAVRPNVVRLKEEMGTEPKVYYLL
ncbi:MAG: 4Fe-4S dicluster domain-containing protein [Armatimonadota bacterium]|nr:4Fe-4S dicluster domain-containing protein [Armatimonadota bacterium]